MLHRTPLSSADLQRCHGGLLRTQLAGLDRVLQRLLGSSTVSPPRTAEDFDRRAGSVGPYAKTGSTCFACIEQMEAVKTLARNMPRDGA